MEKKSTVSDFSKKSKSNWWVFLIFYFLVFGILGGVFLYKKFNKKWEARDFSEVFVAEEVVRAEKNNLDEFFQKFKTAKKNKADFGVFKKMVLDGEGRFKNIPILEAGKETLYGNDLNYYFLIYNFDSYINDEIIEEELMNQMVDILITDSTIIQRAEEEGILKLTDDYFNNHDKNYTKRNELVDFAREELGKKLSEKISGEMVSIWFDNNKIPVSKEYGRNLALKKINEIYKKLKEEEISFEKAGEILADDKEIGRLIDPDYKNNVYLAFFDKTRDQPAFSIENLNSEAWSLAEGQMSQVVVGKEGEEEILFAIIKINSRVGELNMNEEEVVNETEESYEKKVFYEY